MNPKSDTETLRTLRQEPDALRLTTKKLCAKETRPADDIRTKHEVKVLTNAGETKAVESLIAPRQHGYRASTSPSPSHNGRCLGS